MNIQTKIRATAEYLRGIRLPACEAKAATMICAAAVELDKIAEEAESAQNPLNKEAAQDG